jgi:hypothetical protein
MSSSLPYDDGRGRRRLLCWVGLGWVCDDEGEMVGPCLHREMSAVPFFRFSVYNWEPVISSEPPSGGLSVDRGVCVSNRSGGPPC